VEAGDNDIGKCAQATCWQCGEDCDAAVAPSLGVHECFNHLLSLELLVLHTSLVGANSFDHEVLVFFGEALGSHGGVRHPEHDEDAPDDCNSAVADEESLPVLKGAVLKKCKAVSEKASNDLLSSVHHVPKRSLATCIVLACTENVPVRDSSSLFASQIPHAG